MTKLNVNENELAQRWGMSPKTLQRWRSEGRGPRYFKFSRKVVYPMAEIQKFEAQSLYASTSERANDIAAWRDAAPEAAKEDSAATQSPMNQRSGESNNGRVRGQVLCKT